MKAGITGRNVLGSATPMFGCDNMGVVLHRTHHHQPLLKKQVQSDVLRYFKNLVLVSQIGSKIYHVYGHTDQDLHKLQMTLAQQVNIRADKLASVALMEALMIQTFIRSVFLAEGVSLKIGEARITGSPKVEITHLWGEHVAQELFHCHENMHMNDFPLVYWEGIHKVMSSFPEVF